MLITADLRFRECFCLALILCSVKTYVQADKPFQGEIWKYILKWTPVDVMGERRDRVIASNCRYQNCYVTSNRNYFINIGEFDAVVFNVRYLENVTSLPWVRSPNQKYIFAAAAAAQNHPLCDERYDGFFNWTWTYRVDSDVRWGHLTVFDAVGQPVGPREHMSWEEGLEPVPHDFKSQLRTKHKAVAWIVTQLNTGSRAEAYVKELHKELVKYNLGVDVFTLKGPRRCPGGLRSGCQELLRNDYYFFLSFEVSEDKDYVTSRLLTALRNDVVPIVYGGADYSRFLYPNSYLNAKTQSPAQLAIRIKGAIDNQDAYHDFFRWKSHYSYRNTLRDHGLCELCARLNDEELMSSHSVHHRFRSWWNSKRCPAPTTRHPRAHYIKIGSAFIWNKLRS